MAALEVEQEAHLDAVQHPEHAAQSAEVGPDGAFKAAENFAQDNLNGAFEGGANWTAAGFKLHSEVEFHPNVSADALVHLPLHRYQFTLDTVTARYRFGALPNEAHKTIVPIYNESVVRESALPGAPKGTLVPVVEEHILFMHSVAATKTLDSRMAATEARFSSRSARGEDLMRRSKVNDTIFV